MASGLGLWTEGHLVQGLHMTTGRDRGCERAVRVQVGGTKRAGCGLWQSKDMSPVHWDSCYQDPLPCCHDGM